MPRTMSRRQFLISSGVVGGAALAVGAGGITLRELMVAGKRTPLEVGIEDRRLRHDVRRQRRPEHGDPLHRQGLLRGPSSACLRRVGGAAAGRWPRLQSVDDRLQEAVRRGAAGDRARRWLSEPRPQPLQVDVDLADRVSWHPATHRLARSLARRERRRSAARRERRPGAAADARGSALCGRGGAIDRRRRDARRHVRQRTSRPRHRVEEQYAADTAGRAVGVGSVPGRYDIRPHSRGGEGRRRQTIWLGSSTSSRAASRPTLRPASTACSSVASISTPTRRPLRAHCSGSWTPRCRGS